MVYEDIYKIFPEIHEIKDKVLQQKSADALISAMEIGGWDGESVYLAPVTMNWQGCTCSLVEHIRLVTRMCMDDYKHTLQIIQMARAFQNVIRYWHRSVHQYLLGKRSTCSVASR